MLNKNRKSIIVIAIALVLVIVGSVIIYFAINKNGLWNRRTLPTDVCVYDEQKYITCGTAFVLSSGGLLYERVEYPLVANEKFYFPQGENNLIVLIDKTKSGDDGTFVLFLKEGEHAINEETSKRTLDSFIIQN